MTTLHPIALGISKKDLKNVKKELKRKGYRDLVTLKIGKYYNVYYGKYDKRLKKVV